MTTHAQPAELGSIDVAGRIVTSRAEVVRLWMDHRDAHGGERPTLHDIVAAIGTSRPSVWVEATMKTIAALEELLADDASLSVSALRQRSKTAQECCREVLAAWREITNGEGASAAMSPSVVDRVPDGDQRLAHQHPAVEAVREMTRIREEGYEAGKKTGQEIAAAQIEAAVAKAEREAVERLRQEGDAQAREQAAVLDRLRRDARQEIELLRTAHEAAQLREREATRSHTRSEMRRVFAGWCVAATIACTGIGMAIGWMAHGNHAPPADGTPALSSSPSPISAAPLPATHQPAPSTPARDSSPSTP